MVDILALGAVIVGAVVFGVRQEGKINQQVQRVDDLKELINERFDGLANVTKTSKEDLDRRLSRIERTLNGSLVRD